MKNNIVHVVSFSGGRTSAYLVHLMEERRKKENLTVKYLFMDTGAEHPKTYEFIRNVVDHFGIDLVCLRLKASEKLGIANSYVKMELSELKPDLKGWKEMVVKYSTPYMPQGAFCTRAMKTDLFEWYCNNEFGKKKYHCWLGMRADEPDRLKPQGERVSKKRENWYEGISYLADISDFDKQDVNDFWAGMLFDLGINDHLGNCVFCIKKSELRLALASRDEPEFYNEFLSVVNDSGVRVIEDRETPVQHMYRGGKKLEQVITMFDSASTEELRERVKYTKSGQCENSCDILNGEEDVELPEERQVESVHRDVISSDLDADMKNSWGTDPVIFEALNKEFNFALDAAANDNNHKCSFYFTKEDNALEIDWSHHLEDYGMRPVWINPPYGKGFIKEFMNKCIEQKEKGVTSVLLVPATLDAQWLPINEISEIRIVTGGRLSFYHPITGKFNIRKTPKYKRGVRMLIKLLRGDYSENDFKSITGGF